MVDSTAGQPCRVGWKFFGITTTDRPERSEHLEQEFRRASVPFVIYHAQRPTDPDGFETIGRRGCFESHLEVFRQARAEQVEVAVIVQDDIVIARRFPSLLSSLATELESLDWGMCYLGWLRESPCRSAPITLVTDHIGSTTGWEVLGAHFVAIRGDLLDLVVADLEERLRPGGRKIAADGALNEIRRHHDIPTLLCIPNLGHQGPSRSGIAPSTTVRSKLLDRRSIRRPVESVKRVAWDLATIAPPRLLTTAWNTRANLRARFGSRAQLARQPSSGDPNSPIAPS